MIDDLVKRLNETRFDAIDEINESIDTQKPLQEQHVASVELMVQLNGYLQDIAEELKSSIQQLELAGKRVTHETNLLKNDIRAFYDQQANILPPIVNLIDETRNCEVLTELSELNEVQKRISSVIDLLQASRKPSEQTEEVRTQLALVFANTPDAAKYSGSSNYYGIFNKMIT